MTTSTPLIDRVTDDHSPRRLWQVAGGLALTHLVLILAGISLSTGAMFEDGRAGVAKYARGSLERSIAGGYIELLGFLALVPVLVFLARAVGHTPTGRWAAQSALVAGGAYVALTFSPGIAAGATAMHGAHNAVSVDTAWLMNNLRVITYVVSLMLLGAHALGVAVAAITDRFSPRWVGAGGLLTGAVLLMSPLLLTVRLQDVPTLVWSVWWVGLAVQLMRRKTQ